jgi:hypothetical protein
MGQDGGLQVLKVWKYAEQLVVDVGWDCSELALAGHGWY